MPGQAPSRPVAGTVIAGRYEIGELLGRGGMAEVYAGTDRRLGRSVAIKFLLPEMAAQPDLRPRFEAEARAAASLSHPNAVGVFDTGEHDGLPYIVMERLPGETLADRLVGGPVDPGWLRGVAAEILGALGAAHATGLVHRDVKPANVLIAADGRAKVADFGIAKSLEAGAGADLTITGQLLGTPAYVAPERLDGAPATPQSDLWALGVVLYEALAGSRPFAGETALAMAAAAASGTHRPLGEIRPELDPALVAAVERAIDPDPCRRFASAAEMAGALDGATAAGAADTTVDMSPAGHTMVLDAPPLAPADAVEATPLARGDRSPADRRRRAVAWLVAGGLVLLLVLLISQVGDDRSPSVASGSSATTTPATTPATTPSTAAPTTVGPAAALATALRDQAATLGGQGSVAGSVADRLAALADRVEAGGGGPEATALLTTVAALDRAGQLSDATAAEIGTLLRQVPGVDTSAADAVTATTRAPARTGNDGDGDNDGGKGKEQKNNDD